MTTTLEEKKLSVSAIENGTVIDHIPPGKAIRIARLLKLAHHQQRMSIGMNFPSKKLGHKDLLKIEGRQITQEEADKIIVLAPHVTISIIKNFQVEKKLLIKLPEVISNLFGCPNKNCITNFEKTEHTFHFFKHKNHVHLRCHYCEKVFTYDEVKDLHDNVHSS
jgi:aspartate carbamoyltransferase regulatory subunit